MAMHPTTGFSVSNADLGFERSHFDSSAGYLFRATSGGIMRVAGLAPVEEIPGLENIDVTKLVNGHMAYRAAMPRLLREVGWEVESDEFTEIEDPDPENHEKRQRELIKEIDEARKDAETKPEKRRFGFFKRGKLAEKKRWETYDDQIREAKNGQVAGGDDGSSNVLFDIEAIKAELASEQIEVKQLESTLPPMKLSLNNSESSVEKPQQSPYSNLRETKSYSGDLPQRPKNGLGGSQPSLSNGSAHNPFSQGYDEYDEYDSPHHKPGSEHIQMSFDQPVSTTSLSQAPPSSSRSPSYHSPQLSDTHIARRSPSPNKSLYSPHIASPAAVASRQGSPSPLPSPQRPEFRHSNSVQSGSSGLNIEHNAWLDEDDEDFGREKEVKMTFG